MRRIVYNASALSSFFSITLKPQGFYSDWSKLLYALTFTGALLCFPLAFFFAQVFLELSLCPFEMLSHREFCQRRIF